VVGVLAAVASLLGLGLAAWLFVKRRRWLAGHVSGGWGARLWRLWNHAWGFDSAYDRLLVRPYRALVHVLRNDIVDRLMSLAGWMAWLSHRGLSHTQSGKLRLYATSMALGLTLILIVLALGG